LTLFNLCVLASDFSYCFLNDTALLGNCPTLWLTFPGATGTDCFTADIGLTNYAAALAAGWAT